MNKIRLCLVLSSFFKYVNYFSICFAPYCNVFEIIDSSHLGSFVMSILYNKLLVQKYLYQIIRSSCLIPTLWGNVRT